MAEVFLSPQQLGVNLGEFLQLLLEVAVMLNGVESRLLLGWALEEECVDPPHGQALGQVVERAVFVAAVMAMAVGFAMYASNSHFHSHGTGLGQWRVLIVGG
jgi:hypothetical protein